jgi:hypothetical protein
MNYVRTLGLATAFAALAALGCKKETFQTPGANQEELNREGSQTSHDKKDNFDNTFGSPGATPEEVQREQANKGDEPAKKSTTLSTPGESLGEAKGKGLVPDGTGGGPKDDTARPSNKTAPSSSVKSDKDGTFETPGADEKERNE